MQTQLPVMPDGVCLPHRTWLHAMRSHVLFDLPPWLGLFYFLNSCVQSIPLTANTGWLNEDLKMPQPTIPLYYALTFMPWSLKPLYGLLADRVPIRGYHFRPWLAISSIGSACFYVFMAFCVDTIGGAFLVRRPCAAASTHTQPAACLPPA